MFSTEHIQKPMIINALVFFEELFCFELFDFVFIKVIHYLMVIFTFCIPMPID